MGLTPRPELAPEDDLNLPSQIDIDAAIAPFLRRRDQSPIVRPSRAEDVSALIDTSTPHGGESLEQLVEQISEATDAYPRRNTHPGFFGWIAPSGLPSDPLAHAVVTALNENVGGYWSSPVGTTIERTVVGWMAELVGYPANSEGVILSGGSMANLCALASALARRFGPDYRRYGLATYSQADKPVVICSAETHFSVRRAAVMLGIGSEQVISVETDECLRMRIDKLEEALDAQANVVSVIATAGTTNTGAIDPLEQIAALCRARDIWMHVDAAYGGGGILSENLRPRYRGIEMADSVIMDLHKWFYQSLDGSLLLLRDAQAARSLFFDSSDYLRSSDTPSPEEYMFFHIAPELSRRSRALPFYIALRHYGIERLGRNVLHNVQCAEYLAERVRGEEDLELVVAPQLSILCFRFRPAQLDDERVDRLNRDIRDQVQLEGDYLMSATSVNGRPVLRVCIINHATRAEHIEGLLASVLRIGRDAVASGLPKI